MPVPFTPKDCFPPVDVVIGEVGSVSLELLACDPLDGEDGCPESCLLWFFCDDDATIGLKRSPKPPPPPPVPELVGLTPHCGCAPEEK